MVPKTSRRGLAKNPIPYLIAALVLVIDQATKLLVVNNLGPDSGRTNVDALGGLLQLRYATNSGASFGILPDRSLLFTIVAVVVVGAIVIYSQVAAPSSKLVTLSLGLQLGGAAGNLIDRLHYGYVIDFIDFRVWPTFNVADAAILAGVAFLVLHVLISTPSRPEAAQTDALGKD